MIEGHFSPPEQLRRLHSRPTTGRKSRSNRRSPMPPRGLLRRCRFAPARSIDGSPTARRRTRIGVRREDRKPGRTEVPQHVRSPALFTTDVQDLEECVVTDDLAGDLVARVLTARPDPHLAARVRPDCDARQGFVLPNGARPEMGSPRAPTRELLYSPVALSSRPPPRASRTVSAARTNVPSFSMSVSTSNG